MAMHGGTLISGIRFIDCSNIEVSEMRFVGYHECHDFPAIHISGSPAKAINVNGVAYSVARGGKYEWANNCYYYGTDGTKRPRFWRLKASFSTPVRQKPLAQALMCTIATLKCGSMVWCSA
ncbi:MAG: hypothetical protein L6U16_03260 [Porphyromonadaceae bacterium]|nr:MAG: hypothetical protein L6U16_03260 [Porphyromonadaceae bacterium]